MRAVLFLTLLAPFAAARPTVEEALDLDPADPPLGVTFLPAPNLDPELLEFGGDYGYATAVRGDLAFVSAPVIDDAGNGNPGSVHIFRRSGETWAEIQILSPPDVESWMRFGQSLDLSDDGSILVVGSNDIQQDNPATAVNSGAYVYSRNSVTGRYEFARKLVPAGVAPDQWAGNVCAISGDWIAIGAPGTDELGGNEGSVHLFQHDPVSGRWTERQKLLSDGLSEEEQFGHSLTLDGPNLCVAAARGAISGRDSGRIYAYRLDEATGLWNREAVFSRPNSPDSYGHSFGNWMDLSGDRLLASFDYSENAIGHTMWYERVGDTWQQQPTLISDPGGSNNDHQTTSPYTGRVIAQSGYIAVTRGINAGAGGGSGDATILGEVFRYDAGAYTSALVLGDLVVEATAPDGFVDPVESFHRSMSLATDGTTILVAMEADIDGGDRRPLVAAITAEPVAILPRIRPLLFHEDAEPGMADEAAFAYQTLLYEDDGLGSFITRHDDIETLYAQANRDRAAEAENLIRFAYPDATGATADEFETLLLDIAYGRAAAELIRSKNTLRNLNRQRLEVIPDLFLDTEIDIVRTALDQSGAGLNAYLPLLQDPLGVPPVGGDPAGRALFAQHVPNRALVAAIDTDADPDSEPDQLLSGYKDLVLIHDLLLQHTRTTAELVQLLIARDTPADASTARRLIGDTQRLVFEQRLLLDSLFPGLTAQERDELGLATLSDSLDTALTDLAAFEQNLNGTLNLLGYEPDFLMLIQNQSEIFDSFDSFKTILEQPNSALEVAKNNREDALTAIAAYGETQDSLEAEFARLGDSANSAIIPRLTEIVGVPIGEAGYDTPQDNVGSEIWQQIQSIDAARLRVERNSAEITNLHQRVRIEQQRRRRESSINSEISDLIIDYGNQQASMTEEIGRIEAAQKAADSLVAALTSPKLLFGIINVVNGAVQAGAEIGKGNLEASKERLAATQDAAIRDKEDEILGENSKALIRTMLLEMNTLLIDSQEAALLVRQEVGRLTGLYAEQADLERRLAEVDDELAARYFADPVHRLRAINATELANISFRNARRWLFFTARALEYKWNTPFDLPANFSSDGRAWTTVDLFRLRNAHELDRFFIALRDWDTLIQNNRTFVAYDDWFSLREDYFGYDLNDDGDGTPLSYDVVNPDTGLVENTDAVTAFRYALRRSLEDCDEDGSDEICLRFDTLRRTEFDTSANGGNGAFLSDFFSPENYLDRLETIRVFVRGPHQNLVGNDGDNTIPAELSYLGTSVIRNETSGTAIAPDRPDRIGGELTSYPNRFYRFFASGYRFEEGLAFRSAEALKILPGRSRSALEALTEPAAIEAFRERSVATSSWVLTLSPNAGINPGARLVIDEIDDIELYILHRAVQR